VRGLLDGHTWLTRKLATRGHFPAIDVLDSISRLMQDVASGEHRDAAQLVRELLASYRENEDLISIGAYRRGGSRTVDAAIDMLGEINAWLRQRVEEPSSLDATRDALLSLARRAAMRLQAAAAGPATAASAPAAPTANPASAPQASAPPPPGAPTATVAPRPPNPPSATGARRKAS